MRPQAATSTRKNVPRSSENSRRYSSLRSSKSVREPNSSISRWCARSRSWTASVGGACAVTASGLIRGGSVPRRAGSSSESDEPVADDGRHLVKGLASPYGEDEEATGGQEGPESDGTR